MARGRFRRRVLAVAVAVLGATVGAVLLAPAAGAAPTATVEIEDLTPPLVSVDAGGSVTFTNRIEDKSVQVGGGGGLLPSLVTVDVHTDVTLGLPSGQHALQEDQQWVETFPQTCATCTITYTYRATVPGGSLTGAALGSVLGKAVAGLPQQQTVQYDGTQLVVTVGVPTPFLVNTLVPLPDLPGVDLPRLPEVQVPVPSLPAVPSVPGGTTFLRQTTTTTTTTRQGIAGQQYSYLTGGGVPGMKPQRGGTAAFDPRQVTAAAAASGGDPGRPALADASASSAVRRPASTPLSVPALAAVLALAGVSVALARVHRAARRGR
jgi:hypothetical protein